MPGRQPGNGGGGGGGGGSPSMGSGGGGGGGGVPYSKPFLGAAELRLEKTRGSPGEENPPILVYQFGHEVQRYPKTEQPGFTCPVSQSTFQYDGSS